MKTGFHVLRRVELGQCWSAGMRLSASTNKSASTLEAGYDCAPHCDEGYGVEQLHKAYLTIRLNSITGHIYDATLGECGWLGAI